MCCPTIKDTVSAQNEAFEPIELSDSWPSKEEVPSSFNLRRDGCRDFMSSPASRERTASTRRYRTSGSTTGCRRVVDRPREHCVSSCSPSKKRDETSILLDMLKPKIVDRPSEAYRRTEWIELELCKKSVCQSSDEGGNDSHKKKYTGRNLARWSVLPI